MAQPRPTYEVFARKPPPPSYDKFVPATSTSVPPPQQQPQEESVPHVDRLEELRRDDQAYLERIAQTEREEALEELEREKRERHLFRKEQGNVKRRVNVADGVRGPREEPLVATLGLGNILKKRRVVPKMKTGKTDTENNNVESKEATTTGAAAISTKGKEVAQEALKDTDHGTNKSTQLTPLVSGYGSSSEEGEDTGERKEAGPHGKVMEGDDGD